MERMLAAMEPVGVDEAFAAICRDDTASLRSVVEALRGGGSEEEAYEYCNQAW
jgi:hypothetical protein